jgi:3-oxoacyl-[acyl-carrier-protein] synthase-3
MYRSRILGVGSYVPDNVVTNDDLSKMFDTSDEWIATRTGIRERHYAPEGMANYEMAVIALERALENANLKKEDLDFIIFSTLTPDYLFPGSSCLVQKKMNIPGIGAMDIRNQCSGFIYGISVADAFVRAGSHKCVAVIGSEIHSHGLDYSDRGRNVTVLFGDAAGAVIVGRSDDDKKGILSYHLHADGSYEEHLRCRMFDIRRKPWVDEENLKQCLHYPEMDGKVVFANAIPKMIEVIKEGLEQNKIALDEVKLFLPHQANLRINEKVREILKLPPERFYNNIHKYGNTTAATIPLCLDEALKAGLIKDGDLVVMVAFGSGFTWGSVFMRW